MHWARLHDRIFDSATQPNWSLVACFMAGSMGDQRPKGFVLSALVAALPDDPAADDDEEVGGGVGVALRGGGSQLQRPALADVANRRLLVAPRRLRHLLQRNFGGRVCQLQP